MWVWKCSLASGHVNDEFGKLVCVAGTFAFADGHNSILSEFVSLAKSCGFQTVTVPEIDQRWPDNS